MKKHIAVFGLGLLAFSLQTQAQDLARGVVFEDQNQNGVKEKREKGIPGVSVSNGIEVVQTDEHGAYTLPVGRDNIISVIKPAGYDVPVNADMLPQFYYIHKPEGSPDLAYPGVAPTGELPRSVNFPLVKNEIGDQFKMLLFGDPQVYTEEEVEYYKKAVISELKGVQGYVFGLSLGDLVGNRPDLFNPYIQATKEIGLPWYNIMGNHDINFDVQVDSLSDESYEAHFGPANYAFNQGKVHFIILDDIIYPDPRGGKGYWGGLNDQQLAFIENDLKYVPKDHLVLVVLHIPFSIDGAFRVQDRDKLFALLKDYPHTLSFSAHTHTQNQVLMGADRGWKGEKPHHHFISGTTSGNWYSGRFNEAGVPVSMMADGTPKGYSFVTFDGNQYKVDYKVVGEPMDHQINIYAPKVTAAGIKGSINVYANFFMGKAGDEVLFRLNEGEWKPMKQVEEFDPAFIAERVSWDETTQLLQGRKPSDPQISSHLWRKNIPNAQLKPGTYTIEVKATDMYGKTSYEKSSFRVE